LFSALAESPANRIQVLSLKGGINAYLNWLETTSSAPPVEALAISLAESPTLTLHVFIQSRFLGRNVTFDGSLAIGHQKASNSNLDKIGKCKTCRIQSTDIFANCANALCHTLFLQCKDCSDRMQYTCRYAALFPTKWDSLFGLTSRYITVSSICQEIASLPENLCLEFKKRCVFCAFGMFSYLNGHQGPFFTFVAGMDA
jgi:hypothetical protein